MRGELSHYTKGSLGGILHVTKRLHMMYPILLVLDAYYWEVERAAYAAILIVVSTTFVVLNYSL
jgi:hypothetical protein